MKAKTPLRLVRIDNQAMVYHMYEGREHRNTIKSTEPLEADFVEYFRVHTDQVMADIASVEDPEAA